MLKEYFINILLILHAEGCLVSDGPSGLSSVMLVSISGKNTLNFNLRSLKLLNCWIIHSSWELKTQSRAAGWRKINSLLRQPDVLDRQDLNLIFYRTFSHNQPQKCSLHPFNFHSIHQLLYQGHSITNHKASLYQAHQ